MPEEMLTEDNKMNDLYEDPYTSICSERTLQSDKNGFFLHFADHVLMSAGENWLGEKFAMLKTDRERIETLFTDEQIKGVVDETLSNVRCVYRKKDARFSRERRMQGQEMMKSGSVKNALMVLCQSVLRAPEKDVNTETDEGRSLSLALWYRSHALMELGHIKSALTDLQLSQKHGLPDNHRAELYGRMAECYYALGDAKKSKVAMDLAKKLGMAKIEIHILKRVKDKEETVVPLLAEGENKEIQGLSLKLKVMESGEMGRFIVANENVSCGDVLAAEVPFVSCLLPECFGSHCHHCFKSLLAPVGCPNCSALAFCSIECRDISVATYHKHECKILDLLIGSGMSVLCHAALRMVTQNTNRTWNKAENVYKLCAHSDKREPKDLLQRTLMAAFLLKCLQASGFFGETTSLPEKELHIGELLLTNLQILQFNAHEVYETRRTPGHKFRGAKTHSIGIALYQSSALFNHECYPAVTRYFVGKNIILRATRPLKPGEMIAENYGPNFLKKTLPERQRILRSRYWFKCECQACREDWPLLDNVKNSHGRMRCPNKNCDYLFSLPFKDTATCLRCRRKVSLKDSIDKLYDCERKLEKGVEGVVMERMKPGEVIPLLCGAINVYYSIGSAPHRGVHLAQEALRACYADGANVIDL